MSLRIWTLLATLAVAPVAASCHRPARGSHAPGESAWYDWRDLTPLRRLAKDHAPPETHAVLEEVGELLRADKFATADKRLGAASAGPGPGWISVARADVAALHFRVCVAGLAWRLEDGPGQTRAMQYGPDAVVRPTDVSVEALLANLEPVLANPHPLLAEQARIARARVAAFASRCPPNEAVAQRAASVLENDLATLAAQGTLTPDLAFVWAGIQIERYSASAAKPFAELARKEGFDDPALLHMLASIALDEGDSAGAQALGEKALARHKAEGDAGDPAALATAHFILGEAARIAKRTEAAIEHYDDAQRSDAGHAPSVWAERRLLGLSDESAARTQLHRRLVSLLPTEDGDASDAGHRLEGIVAMVGSSDEALELRELLLDDVDDEPPVRGGLRYYFVAMLDAKLGELERATGHAALAKEAFADLEGDAPVDVEALLEQLHGLN